MPPWPASSRPMLLDVQWFVPCARRGARGFPGLRREPAGSLFFIFLLRAEGLNRGLRRWSTSRLLASTHACQKSHLCSHMCRDSAHGCMCNAPGYIGVRLAMLPLVSNPYSSLRWGVVESATRYGCRQHWSVSEGGGRYTSRMAEGKTSATCTSMALGAGRRHSPDQSTLGTPACWAVAPSHNVEHLQGCRSRMRLPKIP